MMVNFVQRLVNYMITMKMIHHQSKHNFFLDVFLFFFLHLHVTPDEISSAPTTWSTSDFDGDMSETKRERLRKNVMSKNLMRMKMMNEAFVNFVDFFFFFL